jgi:hypothetical protein
MLFGRPIRAVSSYLDQVRWRFCWLASRHRCFGTLFWEHAPAAGLFAAGLLLVPIDGRPRSWSSLVVAGCCLGLAIAWRNETSIYVCAAVAAAWPVLARGHCLRAIVCLMLGMSLVLVPTGTYSWLVTGGITAARMPPFTGSAEGVIENVLRYTPGLPADFLVGKREFGLDLPEAVRWAPAAGLALFATRPFVRRWRTPLELLGLVLAGSSTAILLWSPAPHVISGFLIPAPFLTLIPLAPRGLRATPAGKGLAIFAALVLLL